MNNARRNRWRRPVDCAGNHFQDLRTQFVAIDYAGQPQAIYPTPMPSDLRLVSRRRPPPGTEQPARMAPGSQPDIADRVSWRPQATPRRPPDRGRMHHQRADVSPPAATARGMTTTTCCWRITLVRAAAPGGRLTAASDCWQIRSRASAPDRLGAYPVPRWSASPRRSMAWAAATVAPRLASTTAAGLFGSHVTGRGRALRSTQRPTAPRRQLRLDRIGTLADSWLGLNGAAASPWPYRRIPAASGPFRL